MRRLNLKLIMMSIAGLLSSCVTMEELNYDELRPARYSFPKQVKSVGVVNNSVPTGDHRPGIVTIGMIEGDGKQTCESLADVLADSRYFNKVVICDSAFRSDPEADFRTFSQEEVRNMADGLGVDMILSVDLVRVDISRRRFTDRPMPWEFSGLKSKVTPVVHAYTPDRTKPLLVLSMSDSLEWEYNPMISDKFIVEEMAHAAALALGHSLVPYWMPATRLYFDGGSIDMRDAGVCVRRDKWEDARDLWTKVYSSSRSTKKKMRAAYNLALAYEMLGDSEEAVRWIDRVVDGTTAGSDIHKLSKIYQQQLKERIAQMSLLNAQMERFELRTKN